MDLQVLLLNKEIKKMKGNISYYKGEITTTERKNGKIIKKTYKKKKNNDSWSFGGFFS
jgi:hypothetical protein